MQLTFRDIEEAFEINETTLYQWLNSCEMPAVKANDQYYFNSVEVLEWALKKHIRLTHGALKLCEKTRQGIDILTPALKRGGVHHGLKGVQRQEVLGQAMDYLALPEHIDRNCLKEMLIAREQQGCTCIGGGIAIPHVKHPVVLAGMEPMMGLFFLENPVDFAASDGQAVHTLFVILSSSFKGHLSLLSRLAFCLQGTQLQSVLKDRLQAQAVLAAFQVAESKTTKNT